jgi:acetyltransferase-like isoleucine patch superfamily enzyme
MRSIHKFVIDSAFNAYQSIRVGMYKAKSSVIQGKPKLLQPILCTVLQGEIIIGKDVTFGFRDSPGFYCQYALISTRTKESKIIFEGNNYINNSFTAISEGKGIKIGADTIIGCNVQIYDSDFHVVAAKRRGVPQHSSAQVIIGRNVWIGNNCIILKGASIGDNSVVAAGSIVTSEFGAGVVIGGCPARFIKNVPCA